MESWSVYYLLESCSGKGATPGVPRWRLSFSLGKKYPIPLFTRRWALWIALELQAAMCRQRVGGCSPCFAFGPHTRVARSHMIAVKVCIGRSVWWTGSGDPCSSGARNKTDRHELMCLYLDLQSKSADRPGEACETDRQHGGDGTQGSELALPSSFVEPPRRSPLHPPTAKIPRGLRGVGSGASRRQDRPLFAVVAGS